MSSFKDLPEGMEDLGPSEGLTNNFSQLLGSNGEPINSESEKSLLPTTAPPVEWIKDEELSKNNKKPFWYPKLDTPLATEYGSARQQKMFYPGEREMFIQIFATHVSEYLFGVSCVVVKESKTNTWFEPNPEFKKLPCIKGEEPEIEQ